jgi:hypothetical protein
VQVNALRRTDCRSFAKVSKVESLTCRRRRKQPLNCSDAVQGLLLLIRLSTAEIGGLRVSYVQPCEHSSHPRVSRATAPSGPEAQQAPPGAQSTWP